MRNGLAPASVSPFSGLAGVRALAGLGCAGNPDCAGCKCAGTGATAMGTLMNIVERNPWIILVGGVLVVGAYVIIKETR